MRGDAYDANFAKSVERGVFMMAVPCGSDIERERAAAILHALGGTDVEARVNGVAYAGAGRFAAPVGPLSAEGAAFGRAGALSAHGKAVRGSDVEAGALVRWDVLPHSLARP